MVANLQMARATESVQSRESSKGWQDSLLRLLAKLSELTLVKPTLELTDDQQMYWAAELLKSNQLVHLLMAIEQLKNSSVQWINLGTISQEARRLAAATSHDYAPHRSADRIPVSVLADMALCDIDHHAMERLKSRQVRGLISGG